MAIQLYLNAAEVQIIQTALLEYEIVVEQWGKSKQLMSVEDRRLIRRTLSLIEDIHCKYEEAPKVKKLKKEQEIPERMITSPELSSRIEANEIEMGN